MPTVQSDRRGLSRDGRDVMRRLRNATIQFLGVKEYRNAGGNSHPGRARVGARGRSRSVLLRLKSPMVADLRNTVCDSVLAYTITQDHEDRVAMLRLIDRYEAIAEFEEESRGQKTRSY